MQTLLLYLLLLAQPVDVAQKAPVAQTPPIDWEDYESVSMIQLISTPQNFEGRKVRLYGFARMRFEDFGVYLTRDDMEHGNGKNGLWLGLGRDPKAKKLDGHYVLVFGVFTAKDKGHKGANSGALDYITRLEEIPTRTK